MTKSVELDNEALSRFVSNVNKRWVLPEIERRKKAGTLPADFLIRQCLIRLPRPDSAIVQFNGEIGWHVKAKKPIGVAYEKDQPLSLHDIEGIEKVYPPEVDGEQVPFIYIFCLAGNMTVSFNFEVGTLGQDSDSDEAWRPYNEVLKKHVEFMHTERVISAYEATSENLLRKVGLWAAPTLLPYALARILNFLEQGDTASARKQLLARCSCDWITAATRAWMECPVLAKRERVFGEAREAHQAGWYSCSVYALVPQIEGVITDWLHNEVSEEAPPWRAESKIKKLKYLLAKRLPQTFVDGRLLDSLSAFVLEGPALQSFEKWTQQLDESFPGRHPTLHGRYEDWMFTEENSAKLFLLVDTLFNLFQRATRR
jgi:hypothetical protein